MASRVGQIAAQLDPRTWGGKGLAAHSVKHDDDVVIVATGRSAFCKASKGALKDTPVDIFAMEFFKAMIARMPIEPSLVEDIVIGNVRNKDNVYDLRAAALAAGFPPETGVLIVNRFCSSGGMAVRAIANAIQAGEINCGLACGIELMSQHPKPGGWDFSPEVKAQNQSANDCAMPMLQTSENVAGDFNISREAMDAFAARSHQRADAAQAAGKFDAEILPISITDPKTQERILINKDEGIRPGTKKEALAKIRAAAPQWSPANTTGGNASQVTDGAAGVLLMRRSMAKKLGLTPRAKYVASTVTGLAPRIMGIGPSLAIPKLMDLTGITMDQVDLFEINEAFASMAVYCQGKLQIPDDKINVNGGSIALGHPLGTTGARLILTILEELERRDQKVGVTSACIGTDEYHVERASSIGISKMLTRPCPLPLFRPPPHAWDGPPSSCASRGDQRHGPPSLSVSTVALTWIPSILFHVCHGLLCTDPRGFAGPGSAALPFLTHEEKERHEIVIGVRQVMREQARAMRGEFVCEGKGGRCRTKGV